MSTAHTSHFSAQWLQLREPFDAEARHMAAQTLQLQNKWHAIRPLNDQPWRVIDLACGTGANLRWLAPRLGGVQQWAMVDHDAALLSHLPKHLQDSRAGAAFEATVRPVQANLMTQLETLPWANADLVTASALLDLVGIDWLDRFVALVAQHRVPVFMGLNVDGRHLWSVKDDFDAELGHLFAQHQRRDKGMGPALGSDAAPSLQAALEQAGYEVHCAPSDWWLDGPSVVQALSLQRALISGMADAAAEQDPHKAAQVRAWQQRRLASAAQTQLQVGHIELWAVPN
jgi:SAM-dependent methyltransferase